jgi:uncharacterized protein (DUF427 family)
MATPNTNHPIAITPNPHRVRVVLGGFIVAETTRSLSLKEATLAPVTYIPRDYVQMDLLEKTDHSTHCPYKGDASYYTVTAGGLVRENAVWSYESPKPGVKEIAGYVAFYPNRVDAIEEFAD